MPKRDFRLRMTDQLGNRSYIVRENGKVNYFSGSLVPLCLSNTFLHNAAEVKFALQDCAVGASALQIVRKAAPHNKIELLP